MRIFIAPVLIALWLVRMIYRGLIKKNLRQNPDEFYIGAGFTVVWVAIYWAFLA